MIFLAIAGGASTAVGRSLQDLHPGFRSDNPDEILKEVLRTNKLASEVRRFLPGERKHPKVPALLCMDPLLEPNFIFGDTRGFFDVLRIPGSVIPSDVIDAIALAVNEHGVRVLLLTTHTDCAMEKVAHSHEADRYPHLSAGVKVRATMVQQLKARSEIAAAIAEGQLIIEERVIDTKTGRLMLPDHS